MMFFGLYKIMVNKVTFVGFRGGDRPNRPPGSAHALQYFFPMRLVWQLIGKKANLTKSHELRRASTLL